MNSYELSRKFIDFCFENPSKIKPNHYALYFFSIEHCNRLGWKKEFGLPTTMTMEAIGIRSYNTYSKTFNDLVDFGFFQLVERSKNQYSANIIALSNFNKALDKALDKAFIKHTTKQSESTHQSIDSINKPLTINKETINKEQKVYSKEIHTCYDNILINFEAHLQPKNKKQECTWKDAIEKLERIDKIPFNHIERIVELIRKDDFWSKNFLSLPKLRKKNKDGLMYVVVFNEYLKTKHNGNNTPTRREKFFGKVQR